jgi:NAD(P)-dependent dehydrogenase (short-subunit alcohol dehydrogenase family)
MVDLRGRTCVVTGATSGIGEETALGLARRGARVVLLGRNPERGRRALERVRRESGSEAAELLLGDFASLAEVRRLAGEVLERCPQLHLLVNNAGVVVLRRRSTADGFESMFAVNHLAPFLFTLLLRGRLEASAPARIVNVASEAHRFAAPVLDDLQSERRYGAMHTYGRSKCANLLFTFELARRLEGSGVTANCLHPGAVATRLGQDNGALGRAVTRLLRPFFLSPEQGARTSLHVATAPELGGVTGRYFARCREKRPSAAARDAGLARGLWEASARLTGLEPLAAGPAA